ncbi:hypothetical protein [Cumulibacter soli]|uniref:hypothetical protein n=1 Tax=Cumulibacter soli TaxID=2546344 RepID=UPI0010677D3E|nr:hypothetical protein [Cumulibacter soli]
MSHPPPHGAGHGDPHRASDEASTTNNHGPTDSHNTTENHSAAGNRGATDYDSAPDYDSAATQETYDQQYEVYVPDATSHYSQYADYTAAPYADQEQPRLSYFADSSQYYQEQQGAYHQPPRHADEAHYPPAEPPGRTGALWWGIGGIGVIAAILSILVMTGVFDASVDEPGANPQATGDYSNPSDDPKALRVIDKASGISYDYLGEGWKDYSMGVMEENQATVGEYVVTQESVPSGGQFIAQVTSGLLSTSFGSPSAAEFPQVLAEVEESVFGNYYPLPNEPTNQSERALTIDGHDAYERITDLTWDVDGYDSTGERVHLLMIDTGKSAPVFFYCSFPNTHAELYPLIDQVIASIKVDQ